MNTVILMGRLTRDVDTHYTQNGALVATFTVAVNRSYKTEGRTPTDFINCVAWGKLAEFVSHYFRKGNMLAIVGSIQTNSWDRQDGKRQYSTEVLAESVYFTGEKNTQNRQNHHLNNIEGVRIENIDFDIDTDSVSATEIRKAI